MEDQDYILFDQYLLKELASEEKLSFEKRLETDLEFNKSFETYKELSGFLKTKFENESETLAFKNNLKSISEAHFHKIESTTESTKKSKLFTLGKLAIAASVAIFMGLFIFNQFSNPVYSDFNAHDPMSITVRGNTSETITKATEAFNTKDYKNASIYLVDLLEENPNNTELQLYNAIVNIELDNFAEADKSLKSIAQGQSAYKNRARWYLILSKLKQNADENIIIELLKQIPEDADDYKQARQLLDKLD